MGFQVLKNNVVPLMIYWKNNVVADDLLEINVVPDDLLEKQCCP